MEKRIFTSAPGRISLFGEYSWLIGEAIVLGLDNLRTYISVSPRGKNLLLISKNNGEQIEIVKEEIKHYQERWEDYIKAAINILEKFYNISVNNIEIEASSVLPIASGLSSSSTLTVATIGALGKFYNLNLSEKDIARLAHITEHDELQLPCGQMDQYACTFGGLLYLDCRDNPIQTLQKFIPPDNFAIVIGDTKLPKSTMKIASDIKRRLKKGDILLQKHIILERNMVAFAQSYLEKNEWDLTIIGSWLNKCHMSFKNNLQVSNTIFNTLCEIALENKAFGAKITGGGQGGSMFAISLLEDAETIKKKFIALGANAYIAIPAKEGFRMESQITYEKSIRNLYKTDRTSI